MDARSSTLAPGLRACEQINNGEKRLPNIDPLHPSDDAAKVATASAMTVGAMLKARQVVMAQRIL
ncbi:MAG: hypothetical protein U0175_12310 [Caldilineaceae bacterium]